MTAVLQAQLIMAGIKVAKALYPKFRPTLEGIILGNDIKLDDYVFYGLDFFMTGKIPISDEAAAKVVQEMYCPVLREPIKSYLEGMGNPAYVLVFEALDSVLNCETPPDCPDDSC